MPPYTHPRMHLPRPACTRPYLLWLVVLVAAVPLLAWAGGEAGAVLAPESGQPWWIWPVLLFFTCLVIGVVAAMGGVGGGVLFVPIVSSFFPFHLDFVRGAGLLVALSSALAASPALLRSGLANLRLTMPPALVASAFSILGAHVGLVLPADLIQTALGLLILSVAGIMIWARRSDFPVVEDQGWLAARLRMHGVYREESEGRDVPWKVRRAGVGLVLFAGVGFIAGMFGLGAGWANVPVLNLVMGAPLKVAAGSSMFILFQSSASAAWIYLHQGAVLAIIAVPCVAGIMLGSMVGVRLFRIARPAVVRGVVLALLTLSGLRSLLKGTGVWP